MYVCISPPFLLSFFPIDSIITFLYITPWWTVLTLMCYLQFCAQLISLIHFIKVNTMIAFYKCMSTSILLLKVIISYSTIRTFLYITLLWKVLTLVCYLQICAELISLNNFIKVSTMMLIKGECAHQLCSYVVIFSIDPLLAFPYLTQWFIVLTSNCYIQF